MKVWTLTKIEADGKPETLVYRSGYTAIRDAMEITEELGIAIQCESADYLEWSDDYTGKAVMVERTEVR